MLSANKCSKLGLTSPRIKAATGLGASVKLSAQDLPAPGDLPPRPRACGQASASGAAERPEQWAVQCVRAPEPQKQEDPSCIYFH